MVRTIFLSLILLFNFALTVQATTNNKHKKNTKELILFDYENEDLTDILGRLAEAKKINLLFPQAPDQIKTKITYSHHKKLTLNSAWNLALNLLEIAGYNIVPGENFYEVVRNRKFVSKNLQLYIDAPWSKLPNNDEPIRYIYYFKNINLAHDPEAQKELGGILSSILPGGVAPADKTNYDGYGANPYAPAAPSGGASGAEITIQFDPPTNSLILANRANCVRQALEIIQHLDDSGFKETVAILALNHTDAYRIERMVEELLKEQTEDSLTYGYRPATSTKKTGTKYLQNVRAIAVDRTNSLVLMGDAAAVRKLKDLIVDSLDQSIESGRSIVHVKPLQYLDAKYLAPVLQNLVRNKRQQQSSATGATNPTDSFKDVIIISEESVSEPQPIKDSRGMEKVQFNQESFTWGNNLIISAYHDDWEVLEKIIDEMDQPQLQIALEIIIADLKLKDDQILGAQARGIHQNSTSPKLSWQSAQLSDPILNWTKGPTPNPSPPPPFTGVINMQKALDADLLTGVTQNNDKLIDFVKAGASVISFSDGNGIAYVLDLLNRSTISKVLSQPFLITHNHKQSEIELKENRLVVGGATAQSGTWVIKNDYFSAALKVKIMPNISADKKNINLSIVVEISEFTGVTENQMNNRALTTNANVRNNDVLVLGGLNREDSSIDESQVPILSKIPFIGNFFKNRQQTKEKRTLVVFISPKLIYPHKNNIDEYTGNRLGQAAKDTIENGQVFDNVRDPITRFLFPKIGDENLKHINQFVHNAQR